MILGVAGFKRSGKNTFAEFVIEEVLASNGKYPEPEVQYFSAKLKESVGRLFGIENNFLEWADEFKENGIVRVYHGFSDWPNSLIIGREILQRYGTEAHRDIFGEDFWVDQILPIGLNCENRLIIIPDLRFENEARRIRLLGGKIVRINRETFGEEDTHSSEIPLPGKLVDFEIDNNETIDYFRGEVNHFCYHHLFPSLL